MFQINVRSVTYSKRSVGKAEEWFTRGLGRVYSVYDPTQASLAFFFHSSSSIAPFTIAMFTIALFVYYRAVYYRAVYYRAVYYRAVYYRAVYYRANYRTTVAETSGYETRDRLPAAFY